MFGAVGRPLAGLFFEGLADLLAFDMAAALLVLAEDLRGQLKTTAVAHAYIGIYLDLHNHPPNRRPLR